MGTEFLTVFKQVVILFILIFIGFFSSKKKIFTEEGIKSITKFVLFFVTPCVIINSFNRTFDSNVLKNLGIVSLLAVGVHIINILLARLLVREKEDSRLRVYRYGVIFSNCGYMALPLQSALLGNEGVFYGAAFIAVFNLFTWTYGVAEMGGKISFKKIFLNPGVIGIGIGLILFLTPFKLPYVLEVPVASLAALNTPLPMLVIGFYLSKIESLKIIGNLSFVWSVFLRLIFAPMVILGLLYVLQIKGIISHVHRLYNPCSCKYHNVCSPLQPGQGSCRRHGFHKYPVCNSNNAPDYYSCNEIMLKGFLLHIIPFQNQYNFGYYRALFQMGDLQCIF